MLIGILAESCKQKTTDNLIIGKWEKVESSELQQMNKIAKQIGTPVAHSIFTFKTDSTFILEKKVDEEIRESHSGTFEIIDSGRVLKIYREGNKDNLNMSMITVISDSSMILRDLTTNGGILQLKRIK